MADIPINAIDRRIQFTGNTGTGPFAFTFNILADSDIVVYKNDTLLTLTTDYTISTSADGTGSVTLTGSGNGTALVSSDFLTIVGGRQLARTTDFVTAGDLLASSLNEQLDSNVIMVQQLDEKIERTLRIDQSDVTADMVLPKKDNRANKTLGFDANGLPAVGEEIGDYKGNWAASTTYAIRDLVKDTSTNNIFRANTAHTSSGSQPLTTNTDSAKWDLIVDAASATTSANAAAASATAAANSATQATTNGAAQVALATTQATNSATSATASASSATDAQASEDEAEAWAIKTNGEAVTGQGYSSKAWATGGTGVSDTAGSGASKEWAVEQSGTVDGTEYSAKEYAIGSQAGNSSGSAKQWALGGGASYATNTTVDGSNYSARYWAEQAAASADSVDDIYLGAKSSAPTLDNDGNALQTGALYFNNSSDELYVWNGTSWQVTAVTASGFATAGFSIAMSIAL